MNEWTTGKNLGIKPIKFENHNTTKELDDLIYKVEDILYFWSLRYISMDAKWYISIALEKAAKRMQELNLTPQQSKRRNEALTQMRIIYSNLKAYEPHTYVTAVKNIQAMVNFQVSSYLKNKDNFNDEDVIKCLKNNKLIYQLIVEPLLKEGKKAAVPIVKLTSFVKMQNELLQIISNKYSISV